MNLLQPLSVAGALRDIESGRIPDGSSVVCTLTGHGLKDPDTAIAQCDQSAMINVNPTLDEVKKAILDQYVVLVEVLSNIIQLELSIYEQAALQNH